MSCVQQVLWRFRRGENCKKEKKPFKYEIVWVKHPGHKSRKGNFFSLHAKQSVNWLLGIVSPGVIWDGEVWKQWQVKYLQSITHYEVKININKYK